VKLLNSFGFYEVKTGKTSGSAVRFESNEHTDVRIRFHKPHPGNILKPYVLNIIKAGLDEGYLLTDKDKNEDEYKG
jgi:predicted RNA binding protein YcfA (HicA-like mRNA interferase family)